VLGEIDKDFYCSANFPTCIRSEGGETIMERDYLDCVICSNKHRKHPTPEQYKEEYGEDVPDDMPVWVVCGRQKEDETVWEVYRYGDLCNAVGRDEIKKGIIVVACTPFPKPDNDWRPQEVKK